MPLLSHNALRLVTREVALKNLPEAFEGYRIAQISDTHFYERTSEAYYDRVVAFITEAAPDLLVHTGDLIHYGKRWLPLAQRYLSQMRAKDGQLAVLGNHDFKHTDHGETVRACFAASGFHLLDNSHHRLEREGASLWMAGIPDIMHGRPRVLETLAAVPRQPHEPLILLSHNPLVAKTLGHYTGGPVPDLVMSGHTHAGHVFLPWLRPVYTWLFDMRYRYGLYRFGPVQLHVSCGVGSAAFYLKKGGLELSLPRFRHNTMPEVVVLTLRRAVGT